MPDFPQQITTLGPPAAITAFGFSTMLGDGLILNRSSPAAGVVVQNQAQYIWFFIESPVTVYNIAFENGGTVNGNVDVGIYNEAGTLLVSSGSTAQSGASVVQVVGITDTFLPAGGYFMAFASDSATATFMRTILAAAWLRILGCQWEAVFPLPATAAMSTITTSNTCALSLLLRPEA